MGDCSGRHKRQQPVLQSPVTPNKVTAEELAQQHELINVTKKLNLKQKPVLL